MGRSTSCIRPVRFLVSGFALLALASCGGDDPPVGRSTPVDVAGGEACLFELASFGAQFERDEDFRTDRGCGIDTAITLHQSTVALSQPMRTGCPLAVTLARFERQVAAPAARRHFDQDLVRLHHFGSYACRGRSSNRGRLSEHAFARAVDLWGFELADGRIITVEDDWDAGGSEERFLHQVAEGACQVFSLVLGPNSDSAHYNHFHFDIGPWPLCQP